MVQYCGTKSGRGCLSQPSVNMSTLASRLVTGSASKRSRMESLLLYDDSAAPPCCSPRLDLPCPRRSFPLHIFPFVLLSSWSCRSFLHLPVIACHETPSVATLFDFASAVALRLLSINVHFLLLNTERFSHTTHSHFSRGTFSFSHCLLVLTVSA